LKNRSDSVSDQWRSSTERATGPSSARLLSSQYRPCNMRNELSPQSEGCGAPVGANSGFDKAAAPSNRRLRSASEVLATAGSSSCRTHPKAKSCSSSLARARRQVKPAATAVWQATLSRLVLPSPAEASMSTTWPRPCRASVSALPSSASSRWRSRSGGGVSIATARLRSWVPPSHPIQ